MNTMGAPIRRLVLESKPLVSPAARLVRLV